MPSVTTCGQLLSAISDVRDRAQATVSLLNQLDQATVVGKTRPWPPTNPDWRCLFAFPDDPTKQLPPVGPPTTDWRCQVGVEVTVADLSAFLQGVADQCLIAITMLEAEDPNRLLPVKLED